MTLPVTYQAAEKLEKNSNVRALFDTFTDAIVAVAPDGVDAGAVASRLKQLTLTATTKQPLLLQCTQESIMQSVIDAATVGLDISASRGEAALVPFYNNKERRYECMFMPMYKGLARLARNSGEIKRIEAEIVCTNDLFVYTKGTTIFVDWAPALDDRGEAIGAYALVEFTNGGVQATYLSKADIMKVKAFSKMSGKGPWVQWEYEMWKKTVFRNLSKWLSLNSERFHRAVEMSDHEYDLAAPPQTSEASDLNDRLQLNQAVDDADLPEFLTETTNEENHDGN